MALCGGAGRSNAHRSRGVVDRDLERRRSEYARQITSDAMFADLESAVGPTGFAAAPVCVVVCLDTEKVMEVFGQSSIYPAVQNLLLAANALGYGSCLTTGLTLFGVDRVRERLQLPRPSTRWQLCTSGNRRRSSSRRVGDPSVR